mmetsp:Transcript_23829/g.36756  ORF Transcript_23829/g.36756 Transcript_23829/m.36756 type:complete len:395 (+) Transcript_23829:61-1245(+)
MVGPNHSGNGGGALPTCQNSINPVSEEEASFLARKKRALDGPLQGQPQQQKQRLSETQTPPAQHNASTKVIVGNWGRQSSTNNGMQGNNNTSKSKQIQQQHTSSPLSPQDYLDKLLQERGYSTEKFCSLNGGYYCRPSPLQTASHGTVTVKAVRSSNKSLMRDMLRCGLSANPCNNFGESIVHMICRRGDHKLLQVLLDHGATLQVADDFGRTPLHDACWTAEPYFELVETVLKHDRRLINITDCRGSLPLAYVNKKHWKYWIEFLRKKKDEFWPRRDVKTDGEEPKPELVLKEPHSKSVPIPSKPASLDMCRLISMGKISPEEAFQLSEEYRMRYRDQGGQPVQHPVVDNTECSASKQEIVASGSNGNSNRRFSLHGLITFQPETVASCSVER